MLHCRCYVIRYNLTLHNGSLVEVHVKVRLINVWTPPRFVLKLFFGLPLYNYRVSLSCLVALPVEYPSLHPALLALSNNA